VDNIQDCKILAQRHVNAAYCLLYIIPICHKLVSTKTAEQVELHVLILVSIYLYTVLLYYKEIWVDPRMIVLPSGTVPDLWDL